MLLQIPFPGAPWLKLDVSDVPVLIAGFALGPMEGILVLLIKNALFALLRFSPAETVGLPMNFIATACLVLISSWFYQRNRTLKNAFVGMLIGISVSTAIMIPANYLILPIFQRWLLPHTPALSSKELFAMILTFVAPFNLAKDFANMIVTFLAYKRVAVFLRIKDGAASFQQ